MCLRAGVYILFISVIASLFQQNAQCQFSRDRNFFYVQTLTGLSAYFGDLNRQNADERFIGYVVQGGFGFTVFPPLAVGVDYHVGDYPRTKRPPFGDYTRKHTGTVYLRYTFLSGFNLSSYLLAGGGMTFYGTYDRQQVFKPAFGPMAGLGLDIRISDQVYLFVEGRTGFILDDVAVDGKRGDAGFDALAFLGVGLKINIRPTFRPITRIRINSPESSIVNEPVVFTVDFQGNPTGPFHIQWYFGDGNRAIGRSSSNIYRKPGTYTVTVIASDRRVEREARKEILIVEAPEKATIRQLGTRGSVHLVHEPVTFTAEVAGTEPVIFIWNFGDGNSSNERSPSHIYTEEGTYTVELLVDNTSVAGNDAVHRRSIIIDIHNPTPHDTEDMARVEPAIVIPELNTIYFPMGSVQLDAESTRLLDENVERLRDLPDFCVQINVFTDSAGNPLHNLRLSEQRAAVVEQFYLEHGIEARRIHRAGLGQLNEPCPAGDPGPGCRAHRRAESIAFRCR